MLCLIYIVFFIIGNLHDLYYKGNAKSIKIKLAINKILLYSWKNTYQFFYKAVMWNHLFQYSNVKYKKMYSLMYKFSQYTTTATFLKSKKKSTLQVRLGICAYH